MHGPSEVCGSSCASNVAIRTSLITLNRALRGAGLFVKQLKDYKKLKTGDNFYGDTTLIRNLQIETNCASNDTNVIDGTIKCGAEMAIKDGYNGQGGGLYCMGGQCELTSSLILKNRAEKRGGGITTAVRAILQLSKSEILNNIAKYCTIL